jgi:hypothetical protein
MVKVEATPDMEVHLFSVFDEAAAIMAFVFRKFGGDALKMVLAEVAEADQEFLGAQAATLKTLGLPEVATILLEAAASAHKYFPQTFHSWSLARRSTFTRKAIEAGDKLVRKGRIKVRAIIVSDRRRRSMENARLSVAAHCASDPATKPTTKKTRARLRQTKLPMLPPKKAKRR